MDIRKNEVDTLIELNRKLIEENRNLRARVECLEDKLACQVTVADLVAECIEQSVEASIEVTPAIEPSVTINPAVARERRPTLILSDSMLKYVESHGPGCDKFVIPGAGCDKLFFKFLELHEKYVYEHIVIHVGINYLRWGWDGEDIAHEVANLLKSLKDIAPDTKITFSNILPMRADTGDKYELIDTINDINDLIAALTQPEGIDTINYSSIVKYRHVFSIIARDGLHLNRFGVKLVTQKIAHYLESFYNMI